MRLFLYNIIFSIVFIFSLYNADFLKSSKSDIFSGKQQISEEFQYAEKSFFSEYISYNNSGHVVLDYKYVKQFLNEDYYKDKGFFYKRDKEQILIGDFIEEINHIYLQTNKEATSFYKVSFKSGDIPLLISFNQRIFKESYNEKIHGEIKSYTFSNYFDEDDINTLKLSSFDKDIPKIRKEIYTESKKYKSFFTNYRDNYYIFYDLNNAVHYKNTFLAWLVSFIVFNFVYIFGYLKITKQKPLTLRKIKFDILLALKQKTTSKQQKFSKEELIKSNKRMKKTILNYKKEKELNKKRIKEEGQVRIENE